MEGAGKRIEPQEISCLRRPSPRRAAATFPGESLALTVTRVSLPESFSDTAPLAGGGVARNAERTATRGRTRERSKGDRLTHSRHGATTCGEGRTTVGGATVTERK